MTNKPPDAVRSPLSHAGTGSSFARLVRLQTEFAELLQTPRVFVRLQGSEHFTTGRPWDTLYFPGDSPRCGEPRYDWQDRGDGVLLGELKYKE
jgi:hypothetical protein